MRRKIFFYCTAALSIIALISALNSPDAALAKGEVKINIRWEYMDFPLKIEARLLNGKARLWETTSVADAFEAPIGDTIKDSSFSLKPGEALRFVLVVTNPTDKDAYFFAGPHAVTPIEHSLGFKFKCLCVNSSFLVKAGETWYRVVEFRLSQDFVGNEITVTHTIVGIDKERAEAFGSAQHDEHD